MRQLLFGLSLLTFFGCASTNMTSFTDPAFKGSTFHHLLVIARSNNLSTRLWLESNLVQEFTENRIPAKEGILLFPPTRTFTDEQMRDSLLLHRFDAYIVIDVGETGVESIYIPPTQAVTQTTHNTTNRWTSTTTIIGGGSIDKPWAKVRTTMIEASTNAVVWIADSFTGGNGLASFSTVIDSYCGKVLEQLNKAGLVQARPTRPHQHVSSEIQRVRDALQTDPKFYGTPAFKHAGSDSLELGTTHQYECPTSPIGYCVYDNSDDPGHMHCIFCGLPERR